LVEQVAVVVAFMRQELAVTLPMEAALAVLLLEAQQ
jgi:hypothetical protein